MKKEKCAYLMTGFDIFLTAVRAFQSAKEVLK